MARTSRQMGDTAVHLDERVLPDDIDYDATRDTASSRRLDVRDHSHRLHARR